MILSTHGCQTSPELVVVEYTFCCDYKEGILYLFHHVRLAETTTPHLLSTTKTKRQEDSAQIVQIPI